VRKKIVVDFHVVLLRIIGYHIRSMEFHDIARREWDLRKTLTQAMIPPMSYFALAFSATYIPGLMCEDFSGIC